ncbi:MAG TPA: hypothetical protein DCY13_00685 [Verrucomicrobiales bacterium]|nr:hypothetical protein [Verrucomicrobiales bacterium]
MFRTGPVTKPTEEKRPPRIVKTVQVRPTTEEITVTAYGTVIPARRVAIETEVSGRVIGMHPQLRPGGRIQRDEELFTIDPTLAKLTLQQTEAELAGAEANLQEAARKHREAEQLVQERVVAETELASLEAARRQQLAEMERLKARRDRDEEMLRRHVIRAPFNALVLDESVELSQRVDPGDLTVTLVGTDEYWVSAAVPTDKLPWIRLPAAGRTGASVKVEFDTGNGRMAAYDGEVLQLLGDLEEAGRMARVLVRVHDPLRHQTAAGTPPLLLGSYVRVHFDAGRLEGVLAIDRTALREGDRIWVADANGRLQIRDVEVRWRKEETIYIDTELRPGEALIVSDLRVALPDMEVEAHPADEAAPATAMTATDS